MADFTLTVEQKGTVKFVSRRTRYNKQTLHVTLIKVVTKEGQEYECEIPNNYTQWHIDNIIRDYNAGNRSMLV